MHTEEHPTLEQWDRTICMYPGCGAVQPKLFCDPEPEFEPYGEPTEKTPTVDPDAPTIEEMKTPEKRKRGRA